MTIVKPVLRVAVGMQSLAVLGKAVKMVPKKIGKPIKPLKMVKGFTDILVGTALIKPTAKLVESL